MVSQRAGDRSGPHLVSLPSSLSMRSEAGGGQGSLLGAGYLSGVSWLLTVHGPYP